MKTAYQIWDSINEDIKNSGLWKPEHVITTPQSSYTQVSAAHTTKQLEYVVSALVELKKEMGL